MLGILLFRLQPKPPPPPPPLLGDLWYTQLENMGYYIVIQFSVIFSGLWVCKLNKIKHDSMVYPPPHCCPPPSSRRCTLGGYVFQILHSFQPWQHSINSIQHSEVGNGIYNWSSWPPCKFEEVGDDGKVWSIIHGSCAAFNASCGRLAGVRQWVW